MQNIVRKFEGGKIHEAGTECTEACGGRKISQADKYYGEVLNYATCTSCRTPWQVWVSDDVAEQFWGKAIKLNLAPFLVGSSDATSSDAHSCDIIF